MHMTTFLPALAAAACLLLAPRSAAAQREGASPPSPGRLLATYHFAARQATAFPATVTIADSAGTLTATAMVPGAPAALPLTVTPMNADLVLQGETQRGVLTLVLERQNEGAPEGRFSGRWSLGDAEGELRGRMRTK